VPEPCKVLLVGPCPPPHGGVSVHVSGIRERLTSSGIECAILDTTSIDSRARFTLQLAKYASDGWTIQAHTNGHNRNSWLLGLLCGLAGRSRGNATLTLHSGMMPAYLDAGAASRKRLARTVCELYSRVTCVGPALRDAVLALGISPECIELAPASLASTIPAADLEPKVRAWIQQHHPILSTAVFFRPEYGFTLLIEALMKLRRRYPSLGCVVMGSGEQFTDAEKLIQDASLASTVLLTGDVDHDTCLALIARSDLFIRPTLEDGDSLSVREALALRVPVVASRVGSRPPGAILFRAGDVDDLLQKIESAWEAKSVPA
jgi:glycogen synthase